MKKIATQEELCRYVKNYVRKMINEDVKSIDVDDDDDKKLLLDDDVDNDDDATMEKGDVETSDIIEKLNTIRSGRSFRDSAVKGELEQYVEELDLAEKTALFALLKGIAQIVTKEISAEDAVEPSDPKPDVSMKKNVKKSSTFKPKVHVIKKSTPKEEDEDLESPVPITPVKK